MATLLFPARPEPAAAGPRAHPVAAERLLSCRRWDVSPREAVELQRQLQGKIVEQLEQPLPAEPLVAGADVSYDKRSAKLFAAVVVLRLPGLEPVEQVSVVDRARFPYVPGLLSFREAPAVLKAFGRLRHRPDVVMIDGHGRAHPRRFGIASHLGWLLDVAAIGCAKSILCGACQRLGRGRGATAPLLHRGEPVGLAVRTRAGVQPVYVSVGHKMDLATAVEIVLRCAPRFRIPEPTRQAHLLVNQFRASHD
jgi:deoxyribonuclease V